MFGKYKVEWLIKKFFKWGWYNIYLCKYGSLSNYLNDRGKYWLPYYHSNKRAKKKYIIIRNSVDTSCSYLSFVKKYLFIAEWAEKKGFIPIPDIEYEYAFMNNELGKCNQWEFCFKLSKSVKEVLSENNVYVDTLNADRFLEEMCQFINNDENDFRIRIVDDENWREYYKRFSPYVKKWLPFSTDYLHYLEDEIYPLIPAEKCIGVFYRDEMHMEFYSKISNQKLKSNTMKYHPLSASIYDSITIIKQKMMDWGCDKIFLSTMVLDTVTTFQEAFGNNVIYINRNRITLENLINYSNKISKESYNKPHKTYDMDEKERVISYVSEVLILSKCDYLIATKAGGSVMSMVFNGGAYKDVYFFEDYNKSEIY